MFIELAIAIDQKNNTKPLTEKIVKKVAASLTNLDDDPRGRSLTMLGVKLGSIPVLEEGVITHHEHVTRYVYFFESSSRLDPLQVTGVAIDGRTITEYTYRREQPESHTMRNISLSRAWELFSEVDKRVPVQFPAV